ncbi:hypothetical protein B0T26DRAFT_752705 [Lasiosphaeria miniovina]|uniref:Uncharacterized protein n=1 Tax=Lasiosphaeria miniovina TaxID=1954250 RepID=A0AA40AAU0_9PEZI|nr:uncharacterized protein B0T26DRAFT_752705 [Lasiosphaeria miniovina]KAK0712471.1 hypothetical protein B0T26DRAFT_752705 [Lasiosphaeria miniovina]
MIATLGRALFGLDISSMSAIVVTKQCLEFFDNLSGVFQGAIGSALAAGSVNYGQLIAGRVLNSFTVGVPSSQAGGNIDDPLVAAEWEEIVTVLRAEREAGRGWRKFFKNGMWRRTMAGMPQLSGANVIVYYLTYIAQMAGLTGDVALTCGKTLEETEVLFSNEGPKPWTTKDEPRLAARIKEVVARKMGHEEHELSEIQIVPETEKV